MSMHVWYQWETMNLERGLGLGRGTTSQLCCVIAAEMTLEEKPTNTWQRRGAGRTRMVIQVRRGEREAETLEESNCFLLKGGKDADETPERGMRKNSAAHVRVEPHAPQAQPPPERRQTTGSEEYFN